MHLELVRSTNKDQPGYFCYLAKSERINGKPRKKRVFSFGLVPLERIPYLKAALDENCDPHETYVRTQEKLFGKEMSNPTEERKDHGN